MQNEEEERGSGAEKRASTIGKTVRNFSLRSSLRSAILLRAKGQTQSATPLRIKTPRSAPLPRTAPAYSTTFSELPDIDSPQLLGLPANCRLAWEKNAAEEIIAGLKELNTTVVSNKKRGDSTALKNLLALWKKLMSGNPLLKGDLQPDQGGGGWWGMVVGGEARAAARAARALHAALAQLARKPTTDYTLLTVPDEWQLLWAGPDAPDAFVREFSHRAAAAAARLKTPHPQDYMPTG
ncbi:hypothetical protein MSG28_001533, partial [Choristoneura fumiferana]